MFTGDEVVWKEITIHYLWDEYLLPLARIFQDTVYLLVTSILFDLFVLTNPTDATNMFYFYFLYHYRDLHIRFVVIS